MATEESKGGGLTGMDWHEKEMYYFFKYFLKFFLIYYLAGVISL